ncbi:MAG: glycosyltransferase [Rickettsiales bacterium]|jgi:CDP-glycerol glycerophosphotransferase|nr:glycosyltransferase [Rickettsiales bacterium]
MTKISVIIPIYNAEKYLRETLDCIVSQTYENLEIICVLDGAADACEKIIKSFRDRRIKIIRHDKNMGTGVAKNTGANAATGDYIHFMDSDDTINPKFYENMLRAADPDKMRADAVACSAFYEKKKSNSIWNPDYEIIIGNDKFRKTLVSIHGWAWRFLIKRNFWQRHELKFPALITREDMPAMMQMVYYANCVVLCPDAVYWYKNRPGSLMNNPARQKQKSIDRRAARKIIRDFTRKHKIRAPGKIWQLFHEVLRRRGPRPNRSGARLD